MSPVVLAISLGLAGPAFAQAPPCAASVVRQAVVMGTRLTITIEAADRQRALEASEQALRALERAEARLSTWRPESELSRFNRTPVGVSLVLSAELAEDLALAARLHADTGGAFDAAVGPLVEAWGLRTGGRVPDPIKLQQALSASGWDTLHIEGLRAERRVSRTWVDAGGFGKGVGLDAALAALARSGVCRALLDLGGQLAVLSRDDRPFSSVLTHPSDRGRPVLELEFDEGSLATSGHVEQAGHILDPRTGRSTPDFGSITVLASSAGRADGLSTGLYVLGPDAALQRASALPGVEVIVMEIRPDGLVARATTGLTGRLRPLTTELRLEYQRATETRP